ncbi:MAG: hypothetical protein ACKVU0_20365 [Saprospiraceae bacterium]
MGVATKVKSSRKPVLKGFSQVFNPATGNYLKRDTETGKFIEVKKDGKPFEGIPKEKAIVLFNPSISKEPASKAEEAIIQYNLKKYARLKAA